MNYGFCRGSLLTAYIQWHGMETFTGIARDWQLSAIMECRTQRLIHPILIRSVSMSAGFKSCLLSIYKDDEAVIWSKVKIENQLDIVATLAAMVNMHLRG